MMKKPQKAAAIVIKIREKENTERFRIKQECFGGVFMVFILDGNLEKGTHVNRNLWYLMCLRHRFEAGFPPRFRSGSVQS